MFKIFKPYMLLLLTSSSIAMAQADWNELIDCESSNDCPLYFDCLIGKCNVDVGADNDFDGVPNGVDNCMDISNSDQTDLDRNEIGDACQETEILIGTIFGRIQYVDSRGNRRPFESTAKLMREGETWSLFVGEADTDGMGGYAIVEIPLSANDIDDYTVQISGNPAQLINRTLRSGDAFMDLSDDFIHAIDINFSAVNNYTHRVDFTIYPPGDIVGEAMLPNRPVHGGTKVTIKTFSIDARLITKTDITDIGGNYELRGVNKLIHDFSAMCCVTGISDDNEWIISPRYIGYRNELDRVTGMGTARFDIVMEEYLPYYIELSKRSNDALLSGDFKSSFNFGKQALNELQNSKQSSVIDEALLTTNLGSVSLINGQLQDALSYFDTALEILDKNAIRSNALSLAVNNHKMLAYENMGNLKLTEEVQKEIEETLDGLPQKSPDYSFNIIDELILKIHPSMNELFIQKFSESDIVERLTACSENEFFVGGECIPFNFGKN